jgi:hypothetical protein
MKWDYQRKKFSLNMPRKVKNKKPMVKIQKLMRVKVNLLKEILMILSKTIVSRLKLKLNQRLTILKKQMLHLKNLFLLTKSQNLNNLKNHKSQSYTSIRALEL